MYPKRVLQVVAIMNNGGAENMIMNYYRAIDRNKIQFDFLVHYSDKGFFDDEIRSLGGSIYCAIPIRPWTYYNYLKFLDDFFSFHNDYIAVHAHIQEQCGIVLKYAAKYGIKICISNSHIASHSIDLKYPFRILGKYFTCKYTTDRLACGRDAGRFLYNNENFVVLKNAIKVENFVFNAVKRNQLRKAWGLSDDLLVVGHIGRFNPQKNHSFLIDIFKEIHIKKTNSILVLIGDGYLRNSIVQKVKRLGLIRDVKFLGIVSNVCDILQCFDVLLFPSLYEGLPVSIIEAQASGLQCVLSDSIDRETDVTGNCSFLSLKQSPSEWADLTLNVANRAREDTSEEIQKAGYDVTKNISWLTELYLKNINI